MANETEATPINAVVTNEKPEGFMSYIYGALVGGLIIFVVWGAITLAADMTQKQVQKEYLTLTDEASRASFAKRHANHPLGGIILLQQANEYYDNGNFAAAKEAYSQVISSGLKKEPVFIEQAILGQAFAQFNLDEAKGVADLQKIAKDSTLLQSTRAYATTELIGFYAGKNKFTEAKDYLKLLKTFKEARAWIYQAKNLEKIYPQLGA